MNYLQYVNTKQGAKSMSRFSQGNTLPLVQRPFGFARFTPQTDSGRGSWFYHPEDHSFEGIRLTHQPSPWIGDYGVLVFQPQTEHAYGDFWQSWSGIDPEAAVLAPHYMKYTLKRPSAVLELTPTQYGAWVRIEYGKNTRNFLSTIALDSDYTMEYDPQTNRLLCSARVERNNEVMHLYCVAQFDKNQVDLEHSFSQTPEKQQMPVTTAGLCRALHLAAAEKKLEFQISTSYISIQQALRNLKRDSHYDSFDALMEENAGIWNQYLSRVEIQADEETMRTFYSCMYRSFLFPHRAYEQDENGSPIHYAPALEAVKPGYRYTDNGFWDTYRTVYPFFSIVAQQEYREMVEAFVQDYRDSGWLPRWTAGVAVNCMPGTAIDAVIADAAVKGLISGELLETAFEGMEKHATVPSACPEYGRTGIADFETLGYMPYDRHHESVNLTLDSCYFDSCLATMAGILGQREKQKHYQQRSKNYAKIFDPETGFMRGRDSKGNFRPDFIPSRWGNDYTEASAWQTTFAVQHDLEGLAQLMGGREQILAKLDTLFAQEPDYYVGSYQQEIHEMTEMAACDWGQCAISNQPSFHIPYIYAYFGETEKAAYWVKRACAEGFSSQDDGFPGDEDNGSMALWYVFAVLGIYPICPGKAQYTHIPPMADSIKILGKAVDLSRFGNILSHAELMAEIQG